MKAGVDNIAVGRGEAFAGAERDPEELGCDPEFDC